MPDATARAVLVPFERVAGWLDRYDAAHPQTVWDVGADAIDCVSPDGTTVHGEVPFAPLEDPTLTGLVAHLARPWRVGVVLVRRGGFGVALLAGGSVVELKAGRRHVQGRTKAGGWSQQRFARRRDNQAKAAFDAAADHAWRILVSGPAGARLDLLATGGDRGAVAAVLADPRLGRLSAVPGSWLGGVADPTRSVLEAAIADARSLRLEITDPAPNPATEHRG